MAGSARSAAAKHAYRMFAPSRGGGGAAARGGAAEEYDESDVWGSFAGGPADDLGLGTAAATRAGRTIPASRAARTTMKKQAVDAGGGGGAAPGSLPMNIPDWQKILGVEYRDHHAGEWDLGRDDDDDDAYGGRSAGGGGAAAMVPPHELAWRSRAASLSVHEGLGRTLKGRDLSRVRDAVWKKTGFED